MAKKKNLDLGRLTVGANAPITGVTPKLARVNEKVSIQEEELKKPEFVSRGVQMRPEAVKMLRLLSVETGKKQKELVSEALNLLFERYGKGGVG